MKEWNAPYNQLGPLAIPGYGGSGLYDKCNGPHGQKLQNLDVIKCQQTANKPTICREFDKV
ncbi:uncharacterized protein PV06_08616 [Exophiala oligosperma]|uniref:Uncharacterized protein n=1 Tax=Exophiala oligosperma TaxID=215243 RepID=A0A0D2DAE2_9EURO|nr:uncharacterized protein PV06_08616 [Exophiala oligosperma]KIW40063.1 hypothetical protein PV06_08616 [Exophiala oligosperma]